MIDRTTWIIQKLTPALEMDSWQRRQYLQNLARAIKTSSALAGKPRILERLRDLCAAGLDTETSPVVKEVWGIFGEELGESELLH